jgi:glycerol-3-phosphate acyltransferase PlsY
MISERAVPNHLVEALTVQWRWVFLALGAYLLGGIPFGLILSRLFRGQDPRTQGSGNIGATNVFRSVGPAPGILTLVLDVGKGWLPVWLAVHGGLAPLQTAVVGGLAFLGHLFPLYLGFLGGKGVATATGALLAAVPGAALSAVPVFAAFTALTGYVSVGSIAAVLSAPLLVLLWNGSTAYFLLASAFAVGVLWTHRQNISRLRRGAEKRWR